MAKPRCTAECENRGTDLCHTDRCEMWVRFQEELAAEKEEKKKRLTSEMYSSDRYVNCRDKWIRRHNRLSGGM